ncbi:hypothetical protein [Larsenimonas suaedae]|uniref:Uncharacterized protein n=1 Tax=Larsenimonas suaedae TaxID=1851019 RepID=A0ABU1GZ16_9GAMM|nr:hypothetical protein [Larsenimonas suaedae]MCM2973769.1 hypothetical protein [Larsenimonas suaedae]MDR5897293.1 hypothetical protein [Larsenimonas suaedae]
MTHSITRSVKRSIKRPIKRAYYRWRFRQAADVFARGETSRSTSIGEMNHWLTVLASVDPNAPKIRFPEHYRGNHDRSA